MKVLGAMKLTQQVKVLAAQLWQLWCHPWNPLEGGNRLPKLLYDFHRNSESVPATSPQEAGAQPFSVSCPSGTGGS